jgi:Carboxypeptidase regulatory-like domain
MPSITGTVRTANGPADGAYVQLTNLDGDFQGEVRTDAEGKFVLHPVAGRWRLVSWWPGHGRTEQEVEVGNDDINVDLTLS